MMMMETELASRLFDEQRIVFAKAWAYEMNLPLAEAATRLEAFFSANLEKLDSTWITMQHDSAVVVLTRQREHSSSKLFSIQKKSTLDSNVLGLELEHNRRQLLQNDPKERLLHNALGAVKFADLKVSASKVPISFKPAAAPPAKPATTTTTSITAASFFKKVEAEPEKKPTMTPIERKAAAAAAAAAAAPKPAETKKSPVVVSSSSEASFSSEEEEEEELGASAPVVTAKPPTKRKTPTKPEAATKKKSKVVLSDDDEDDEAKAKAKQEKKEAKRIKREEEKLAAREEKKRQEIELANEAKADFVRHQLGATTAATSNKVKKRVLKTKTFIDEDGFEVTEDVFEEIEVDDEPAPAPAPAPAPVVLTKTPSLIKKSKSQPSGKQVQLTSFFTKKTKE